MLSVVLQLAILGACRCLPPGNDPCPCALSATRLSHLNSELRVQTNEQVRQAQEASDVTDVYRVAFEEQLEQNRELVRRLADVTLHPGSMSRGEKARAALKWIVKQLNEGRPALFCNRHFCPVVSVLHFRCFATGTSGEQIEGDWQHSKYRK